MRTLELLDACTLCGKIEPEGAPFYFDRPFCWGCWDTPERLAFRYKTKEMLVGLPTPIPSTCTA